MCDPIFTLNHSPKSEPHPVIQDALTPHQLFRTLLIINLNVFGVGLGIGFMFPLISIVLESQGVSSTVIGINHALGALAILMVGPFVPLIIQKFGAARVILAGLFSIAGLITFMPQTDSVLVWCVLRFAWGAVLAGPWISSETLMNLLVPEKSRGRWLATYGMMMCLGLAIGPQVLQFVGTAGSRPFYIASGLLVIAAIPIFWCPALKGIESDVRPGAWLRTFSFAPLAMFCGFYTGLVDTGVLGLLPVYGMERGLSETQAVWALTWYLIGQTVLIPLLGWMLDHFRPTTIYRLIAIVAASAALSVATIIHLPWQLAFCVFLWGGVNGVAYSAGLTNLGRVFSPRRLAAANTTFVIFFNMGSATGPIIAGIGIDLSKHWGLPVAMALPALILGLITLIFPQLPSDRSGITKSERI